MTDFLPLRLAPERLLGGLECETSESPIPEATWYTAREVGDGLEYRLPAGALAGAHYLTADMLLDGTHLVVFQLTLREGEDGPECALVYGALNQCTARIRMPLGAAVDPNQGSLPQREGACLFPELTRESESVNLDRVDRMTITVFRKSDRPIRWCLTPLTATSDEPPLLKQPVLPRGPLLDELGQNALHDWPGKSQTPEEVTQRLRAQLAAAPAQQWPESFSPWGGLQVESYRLKVEGSDGPNFQHSTFNLQRERSEPPTGFFRTHHDGRRWWLVDPDGYPFWSAGLDAVRVDTGAAASAGLEAALAWMPERDGPYRSVYGGQPDLPTINYLAGNLIRAFGPESWSQQWAEIALAELRCFGFNTVGNWSDCQIASAARFPYVRPVDLSSLQTPMVYHDFPDAFHPAFAQDAADCAAQLRETATDPAMIGYFLTNEPQWEVAQETPAAGMLSNIDTRGCATRVALADFLRRRYGSDAALSAAWGFKTTFAAVAGGGWSTGLTLTEPAQADLAEFSGVMVQKLFGTLSEACRAVDPNHLNLGARYASVSETVFWAVEGLRCFDVFSVNCYAERVKAGVLEKINWLLNRPILVGEWHFGALDVGLPGSGVGHVRNQVERGQAYRCYLEDAAAKPWCVGAHWFRLYDDSALGRFDGSNNNIGFLDICHRRYEPLATAARASHERLYAVARGDVAPYTAPEYLACLCR